MPMTPQMYEPHILLTMHRSLTSDNAKEPARNVMPACVFTHTQPAWLAAAAKFLGCMLAGGDMHTQHAQSKGEPLMTVPGKTVLTSYASMRIRKGPKTKPQGTSSSSRGSSRLGSSASSPSSSAAAAPGAGAGALLLALLSLPMRRMRAAEEAVCRLPASDSGRGSDSMRGGTPSTPALQLALVLVGSPAARGSGFRVCRLIVTSACRTWCGTCARNLPSCTAAGTPLLCTASTWHSAIKLPIHRFAKADLSMCGTLQNGRSMLPASACAARLEPAQEPSTPELLQCCKMGGSRALALVQHASE